MATGTFSIRPASAEDCGVILDFIKQLAEYEKLSEKVVATEQMLHDTLFKEQYAEVVIGEEEGKPVGFALFYPYYSTFFSKPGMYLEDLYVKKECRGRGYGEALIKHVAGEAAKRGWSYMKWACLDWNESSIAFYKKMGAVHMDDWLTFQLDISKMKA